MNTDLWDRDNSEDLADPNGDTPFMVLHHVDEAALTPAQKDEMDTDEIMSIYSQKYGKKSIVD